MNKSRLNVALPPALLIVLNIFLFGAATIYQGNTSEFDIDFIEILRSYSLPIFVSLSVLLGISIFSPRKYLSSYVSLLFAFGIMVWIQGNFLVWEYGVFDGEAIEWSIYTWQGWVDAGLWIVVLTVSLIFHNKISRISSFTSLTLIVLQSIFLIATYSSAPQTWTSNFSITEKEEFPKGLFHYSSSFNIVHIILDSFQTDVFQEIVEENNLSSDLDGFVFFRENMGTDHSTLLSIPAIFSGETYRGNVEKNAYAKTALSEKGFQNILFNEGYDVNLIPGVTMPIKNFTRYYWVPGSYGGTKKEKQISEAATLMDLVLFRHLPHFLKKKIYSNQNWLVQTLVTSKKSGHFQYKDFFEDYIDNMQVKSSRSAYHFIHLLPPHPPYVTDKNCNYTGGVLPSTRDRYKTEARCVLNLFLRFIKKLDELGLYDSSLVILQADTGKGFLPANMKNDISPDKDMMRSIGQSLALLAIKPPNKKGAMTISNAKTTNTDIAATVMEIAGLQHHFNGISVFEIDPAKKRERWFDNRFKVTGSVYDYQSWKKISSMSYQKKSIAKPYHWGSVIQFGFLGNSQPYQTNGWSHSEDGFVWTVRKNAVLTIAVASTPSSPLILKTNLRAFLVKGKVNKQTVHVLINGQKAGTWLINKPDFQNHLLTIPTNLLNDSQRIVITFQTPDAISPTAAGYVNDNRTLGIAVHSIVLFELVPYQWGSIIQFGKEGNAQPYQSNGWSEPEDGFTWGTGNRSSLTIPLVTQPRSHLTLYANIMAFLYPDKVTEQTVHIAINGQKAGSWVMNKTGFHEQTLIIPATLIPDSNHMVITFDMPDAISPSQTGSNTDERVLGIALRSIKFIEQKLH